MFAFRAVKASSSSAKNFRRIFSGTLFLWFLWVPVVGGTGTSGSSQERHKCPTQCDCFNYYETVDCSRRGLLGIPPLSGITRRLYMEGNQVEDLPVGILQAAVNLSVLILENNRIVSLSSSNFCGQEHLQELDVSNNQIDAFLIDFARVAVVGGAAGNASTAVCRTPSLKELNLSHNLLRSVPANLSEFAPNLEELNLSYNEITSASLDQSYASMSSLRYLDLSRNDIRRVLAADLDPIRHIPLETINLSDCGVVYMEEWTFRGMDSLTSLSLARSLVNRTVLERVFRSFSPTDNQMAKLDVSETYISNLTVEMVGGFSRLVNLFASYCDLENIDPELFLHLPDLETLHVEGGQLVRLGNVSSLKKLRKLSAHMNRLSELDLRGLFPLESADLSYNHFERLGSGWIGGMEEIQTLNMSHNKITAISSDAFFQTYEISTLDLSYNQLASFPNFGSVRVAKLDVSHNGMKDVDEGAFDILHQTLNELDMSYNDFAEFPGHAFKDFHLLQYLGLSHNKLGEAFRQRRLGGLFESLLLVQVLDLSHNGITVIDERELSSLHHLNTLYLQGNRIRDVKDASLDSTRVLAKLVMSGNQLHTVDADLLTRLEYLEEIDLSDNPFECTCSLVPFLQWANTTMVTVLAIQEHSSYLCDFPPDTFGKSVFLLRLYPHECQQVVTRELVVVKEVTSRKTVMLALVGVCVLVAVGCVALLCYLGQVCQRMKNLRYRWQIRYREVSAVETCTDPKV